MKKTMADIKKYGHIDIPYYELSSTEIKILLIILNAPKATVCSRKDARQMLQNFKTGKRWRNS